MIFEDIFITMNSTCKSTSGIDIPSGVLFEIPAILQGFDEPKLQYILNVNSFYNQDCYDTGKSRFRIENLNEYSDTPELGRNVADDVLFTIQVSSEDDIDTNEKRKNLIIDELATKLGKPTTDFS